MFDIIIFHAFVMLLFQVVMNFMYTDLPMSLVLGLNAQPTSVTKPVDSSYLLSQKYEQPELDKVAGGKHVSYIEVSKAKLQLEYMLQRAISIYFPS